MNGRIVNFDEARQSGHVRESETGRRYFYHIHNVRLDELGYQLPRARDVGTTVEFSVYEARPGWMIAHDIHPYESFAEPVDLTTHRELSVITRWKPHCGRGFAERASGDWLNIREADILTEGVEILRPGSSIWHGIGFGEGYDDGVPFDPTKPLTGPAEPKFLVRAREIEICLENVEPEPESAEPTETTQAVHPLLTARFRSVRLRDIKFRKTA